MSPNLFGTTAAVISEASQTPDLKVKSNGSSTSYLNNKENNKKYPWKIVWRNVIAFLYLHFGALYGLYLFFDGAKFLTVLWTILVACSAAVGITAGAHRLWCHRAYKAKWPLRVILMIFQTTAFQNHLYEWVRDHRVHHKFTDTDADPHNAKRGFFFSHMGWLLLRKHPDVISKGASVDMSDLDSDPVVVWQRRLYIILMPLFCFVIPAWIPCYFWDENPMNSWSISATDNVRVALGAFGEGWHNYHHVFPWDYKAAELGDYSVNFSTAFIDFFAKIGWAYDLKTVPLEMIEKRAKRTGDGTRIEHDDSENHHEGAIWGWGDKDMHQEDIEMVHIINSQPNEKSKLF
ncbi:unnamed protein product [Trichogramma brassicae]|uniref:Fatty acid desaturase domain-containing protein n=1 Tax=Trichogramma brassicae TaxID=86971 RepID=A0A6H5IYD9_9HYME|nr:unnamed protein product [Trichogramma brassicae]